MKRILSKISIVLLTVLCLFSISCKKKENNNENGNNNEDVHDSTKWFTEEELTKKGLSGLTAPTELTGEMSSSDYWFNDGYSFSQICPSEEVFFQNAKIYFDYFSEHYEGKFGTTSIEKFTLEGNENWYLITPKTSIDDYYDDNPSKLYKFYYVTDTTLEDGYFKNGSVFSFEIRYEFDTNTDAYKFKIFITTEDTSRNGVYTNHYRLK